MIYSYFVSSSCQRIAKHSLLEPVRSKCETDRVGRQPATRPTASAPSTPILILLDRYDRLAHRCVRHARTHVPRSHHAHRLQHGSTASSGSSLHSQPSPVVAYCALHRRCKHSASASSAPTSTSTSSQHYGKLFFLFFFSKFNQKKSNFLLQAKLKIS